jgi:hypothetical protein
MYNLTGDADLVLQQWLAPTMAPYFDTANSTMPGKSYPAQV